MGAEKEMWGGEATLVAVVMVRETLRKGMGPGRTIEIERRDVSGFVREENLGCPDHVDIFVDICRDATPLPRESWPTFAKCKA